MIRTLSLTTAILMLVSASSVAAASPHLTDRLEWIDQFGTPAFDSVDDISAEGDSAYAVGRVGAGALPGQTTAGGSDTFVKKYASDGTVEWTRQFGTPGFDGFPRAVTVDGTTWIVGVTTGVFAGETQAGGVDMFLTSFSSDGTQGPTRQLGTPGFDYALDIAVVADNVYLLGMTDGTFPGETQFGGTDFFVAKLTQSADVVWVRQFGTPSDDPAIFTLGGLTVDDDAIYVASTVDGELPGSVGIGNTDAFVSNFDADGNQLWTKSLGTACSDIGSSLALNDDHLVVTGLTLGDINDPNAKNCSNPPPNARDSHSKGRAFVELLDLDGIPVWSREFDGHGIRDGDGFSLGTGLALDSSAIYVASEFLRTPTAATLDPACPNHGWSEDFSVRAYDYAGNELWTQTLGTTQTDSLSGIASTADGVVAGGSTACAIGEATNQGGADAVVLKFDK